MAVAAFSTLVASLGGATASGRGIGASAEINTSRPIAPAASSGTTDGVTALAAADASGGATLGSGSNPASAGGATLRTGGEASADDSSKDATLLREAEALLTQISRAADGGGQIGQLRGRVEDYLAALRPVAAAELAARARTMLVLLGTAAASQEAAPAAGRAVHGNAAGTEAATEPAEATTEALAEAASEAGARTAASLAAPDTRNETGTAPRPGSTDLSGLLTLPGVLPAPGQAIRLPPGGETGTAPGSPRGSLSGSSLAGTGLLQSLAALAPVPLPSVDYRA